jgi:dihydrofolate reductase
MKLLPRMAGASMCCLVVVPTIPDIVEGIRRIRSQDGPNIFVSGSSTLTSTLLEHGLADEVILVVYPVLLGAGKRLFAQGTPPRSFELVSTKAMPSGIIFNFYKAAGSLKAAGQFDDAISERPGSRDPAGMKIGRH